MKPRLTFLPFAAAVLASLGFCSAARAGLIFDQPPQAIPTGGQAADTLLRTEVFNQPYWQELADDIALASDAVVRRLVWWGFYGHGEASATQRLPPAGNETMRVRFYSARPSDGLPDLVVHEESFLNATRSATGRNVSDGGPHPEYRYEADLSEPFSLQAGSTYWLSISQVGDINSYFRWSFSPGNGTPYALRFLDHPDWLYTGLNANQAFQLSSIPEPQSVALCTLALAVVLHARGHRTTARGRGERESGTGSIV
jgi:hypothetical protein